MKHIIFLFLFLPILAYSQGGTWPVKYNDSDPSGAPSAAGTRLHFNTATNTLWFWEPAPSSTWRKQPKAFDQISGCAAPAYTPTARQSTFAVNSCTPPELYQYTGSAWECLNCVDGLTLTAGAGIALAGTAPDITISANDASATNELNTSLSVTGGNLLLIDPGGNLDVPVSSIAPVQAVSAGTGISISGTTTRTITNTAPDQTVAISAGTGIGVTGTYPNFTVSNSAPAVANDALGTGFTSGGGTGTIPTPTYVTVSNGLDFILDTGPSTSVGADVFIGDYTGMIGEQTGIRITNAGAKFGGDDTYIIASPIDDEAYVTSPGAVLRLGYSTADLALNNTLSTFRVIDYRPTPIGLEYAAYYPDIETNDPSIPSVQNVKALIASENGALGTGFTAGGGSGTIPDETVIAGGNIEFSGSGLLFSGTVNFTSDVGFDLGFIAGAPIFTPGYYAKDAVGGAVGMDFDVTDGDEKLNLKVNDATAIQILNTGLSIFSGGIQPAQYDNASAPDNCIFYSTTDSKLSYKDPGGTVHNLY